MREGSPDELQIEILPQFLPIKHHFVREGSPDALQITILPQFLAIEPHFVREGSPDALQIAILPQFLAIEPHFVRKGCTRTSANQNRNFISAFGDRTKFRAKRLRSDKRKSKSQFYFSVWRSNFISCERVATGTGKSQFYRSF